MSETLSYTPPSEADQITRSKPQAEMPQFRETQTPAPNFIESLGGMVEYINDQDLAGLTPEQTDFVASVMAINDKSAI